MYMHTVSNISTTIKYYNFFVMLNIKPYPIVSSTFRLHSFFTTSGPVRLSRAISCL